MTQITENEMAATILEKTDNGNGLCPKHLWLIYNAVNGYYNERGEKEFQDLFEKVMTGKYEKSYFCGIKNMTINYQSAIYWNGIYLEEIPFHDTLSKNGKERALELAKRCRHLERIGAKVNYATVFWHWDKYKNKKKSRY